MVGDTVEQFKEREICSDINQFFDVNINHVDVNEAFLTVKIYSNCYTSFIFQSVFIPLSSFVFSLTFNLTFLGWMLHHQVLVCV